MGRNRSVKAADEECEKTQEDATVSKTSTAKKPRRKKRIRKESRDEPNVQQSQQKTKQADSQISHGEIPIQYLNHQENDYICPLCLKYIALAVTGPCGHSYCHMCIDEYLLFFDECVKCSYKLRELKLGQCKMLENLIEEFITAFHNEELEDYNIRVNSAKEFINKKTQFFQRLRPQLLETGIKIDVRDPKYIWCTATIFRTICKYQQNRIKFLFVVYDGKDKSCSEEISEHSPRLATLGFYTSRKDVPHYKIDRHGEIEDKTFVEFNVGEDNHLIPTSYEEC